MCGGILQTVCMLFAAVMYRSVHIVACTFSTRRCGALVSSFDRIHCHIRNMSSKPNKSNPEMGEELKDNPYYDKYAQKILALQKTNPEEFLARCQEYVDRKMKPNVAQYLDKSLSPLRAKSGLSPISKRPKTKALSDIMLVELIDHLEGSEISMLWQRHFKDKDCVFACIPTDIYKGMQERGKKFPIFLLPLPRGQGYEFFLCQVDGEEVHFTTLENYQTHKEGAAECLTIVHYIELMDKGIVLMRGEFDHDTLNVKEAQCLANQFQMYYGKDNEKRLALLQRLNYKPDEFRHMDLIAELETISL